MSPVSGWYELQSVSNISRMGRLFVPDNMNFDKPIRLHLLTHGWGDNCVDFCSSAVTSHNIDFGKYSNSQRTNMDRVINRLHPAEEQRSWPWRSSFDEDLAADAFNQHLLLCPCGTRGMLDRLGFASGICCNDNISVDDELLNILDLIQGAHNFLFPSTGCDSSASSASSASSSLFSSPFPSAVHPSPQDSRLIRFDSYSFQMKQILMKTSSHDADNDLFDTNSIRFSLVHRYPLHIPKFDNVFASGFSNGGMLSARLACRYPDLIDGVNIIGAVSAPENGLETCDTEYSFRINQIMKNNIQQFRPSVLLPLASSIHLSRLNGKFDVVFPWSRGNFFFEFPSVELDDQRWFQRLHATQVHSCEYPDWVDSSTQSNNNKDSNNNNKDSNNNNKDNVVSWSTSTWKGDNHICHLKVDDLDNHAHGHHADISTCRSACSINIHRLWGMTAQHRWPVESVEINSSNFYSPFTWFRYLSSGFDASTFYASFIEHMSIKNARCTSCILKEHETHVKEYFSQRSASCKSVDEFHDSIEDTSSIKSFSHFSSWNDLFQSLLSKRFGPIEKEKKVHV